MHSGLCCVILTLACATLAHSVPRALQADVLSEKMDSFAEFPSPQYFAQRQDHFDGKNNITWLQAYYVNDTFWSGDFDAPVFLCVGGEGPPIDGSAVVASVHCNDAVEMLEETGALMLALEHRYYGCHNMSACPVQNLSASDAYQFHSSRKSKKYLVKQLNLASKVTPRTFPRFRQALEDIARFHEFITSEFGLTAKNKWVTFGGSYPGMLAGWARLRYPHLIHAAVASSAPVRAELDMQGYFDVVAQAYNITTAGGSPECHTAIADGHAQIGKLMNGTDADRKTLGDRFGVDPKQLEDVSFQRNFAGYGVASFPAQSNDPDCEWNLCNIEKICALMTNTSLGSSMERLAQLRSAQLSSVTNSARGSSDLGSSHLSSRIGSGMNKDPFWAALQRLQATAQRSPDLLAAGVSAEDTDFDPWSYQTCAEFAFYQTCEVGSQCMFTQGLVTLDVEMAVCENFNISPDLVAVNVRDSNTHYGGDHPSGSRVLYPNGDVDPWHANSILSDLPGIPTLMVKGASHHYWTHPSKPSDSPEVLAARGAIRKYVVSWLKEA